MRRQMRRKRKIAVWFTAPFLLDFFLAFFPQNHPILHCFSQPILFHFEKTNQPLTEIPYPISTKFLKIAIINIIPIKPYYLKVQNFREQKRSWMACSLTAMSTLHQKNAEFDVKEGLVKKLEMELAQHKVDMVALLHESEGLKASSDRLKTDIQCLGDDLINQKQAYQQWEDTLKAAEQTRAECLSKWEELRQLDFS
ncbi:uncharacterized protein [Primulina eburnea]|uniref:uncharacterized protein n=1 Tax=Primulina eburnea TaxID=1245227 RepID=UPI003C6C2A1D